MKKVSVLKYLITALLLSTGATNYAQNQNGAKPLYTITGEQRTYSTQTSASAPGTLSTPGMKSAALTVPTTSHSFVGQVWTGHISAVGAVSPTVQSVGITSPSVRRLPEPWPEQMPTPVGEVPYELVIVMLVAYVIGKRIKASAKNA